MVMKKEFVVLLGLFLCSFVMAQSSEIVTNFNVGSVDVGQDYVPPMSFWDIYSAYVVGLVIVLIIVIVFLKKKKRKVVKRVRKISKRKIKKKK